LEVSNDYIETEREQMSGVELEKPVELLYNYTLYGGIIRSARGLNSEYLIPM
jgi:hypothetical protein